MTDSNESVRGRVVAWRIKWSPDFPESDELLSDGERLIACQALDNPPYIDALVLATDYAALQSDLAAAIAKVESLRAKLADEVEATRRAQQRAEQAEWNEVAAIARAEAAERDARRWQHIKDVMTHSYGDGRTEPVEYCLHLEWQQGSWIRDGSNGGRGRPDTFPGWDFIVDEMIGQQERELAELEGDASTDAAIAAQQAEGEGS